MFFPFAMFGVQMNGVMKSFWYLLDVVDGKVLICQEDSVQQLTNFFMTCLLAEIIGYKTDSELFYYLSGKFPQSRRETVCGKAGKW